MSMLMMMMVVDLLSGEIDRDTYIHYDRRRLFLLPISYSAVQRPTSQRWEDTLFLDDAAPDDYSRAHARVLGEHSTIRDTRMISGFNLILRSG